VGVEGQRELDEVNCIGVELRAVTAMKDAQILLAGLDLEEGETQPR
jgi:hypothetical protein